MAREIPLEHPGTILLEEWLNPMGISQYALAKAIDALGQPADALRYRACARGDGRHDRKNSPLRSLACVKSGTTLNSPRRGSYPLIAGRAKPV